MTHNGWGLFRLGIKRRKKELRRLRVMMGLAVLFLSFVLLFQDAMNAYTMEMNYHSYGKWLLSSPSDSGFEHPFLTMSGTVETGSRIYLLTPRLEGSVLVDEDEELPAEEEEPRASLDIGIKDHTRDTSYYVGFLSEDFAEENYIGLYEGRFPQAADEIVMELSLLQTLGLSQTLGQTVSFYVAEPVDPGADGDSRTLDLVSFTLVGTIERYTARWNGGGALPGAIISQTAYDALSMEKRSTVFYSLRPEYRTADVWSFALDLLDGIQASDRWQDVEYTVNAAAFYNPFWGNPTLYRDMTIVLMTLSASILAYLMASFLSKRKKYFMRLREIGASTAEVWKMAAYECVLSVLPTMILMLALSYGIFYLTVFLISKAQGIEFFVGFSVKTFLTVLIVSSCTLLLSLLAALIVFSGQGITEKRKGFSPAISRRLRRRSAQIGGKKKRVIHLRESMIRLRRIHSLQTYLLRLAGLLVCVLFLFCVNRVYETVADFNAARKMFSDFSIGNSYYSVERVRIPVMPYMDRKREKNYELREVTKQRWAVSCQVPSDLIDQALELPGISEISFSAYDTTHTVSWEGKEEDAFWREALRRFAENYADTEHPLDLDNPIADTYLRSLENDLISIECRHDARSLWQEYEKYTDPSVSDYSAFLNGEQVVIVVDNRMRYANRDLLDMLDDSQTDYWLSLGPSFHPGDSLTLKGANADVKVVIAGIVMCADSSVTTTFQMLGSDALALRLAEADGTECGYNSIRIDFGFLSDRENPAKSLSELCSANSVSYSSNAEVLKEMQDAILQSVMTYGLFGMVLMILYLFVSSTIAKEQNVRLQERLVMLHRFGCSEQEMRRGKQKDSLLQSLFYLFAIPAYVLLTLLINRIKYANGTLTTSLGRVAQQTMGFNLLRDGSNHPWFISLVHTIQQLHVLTLLAPVLLFVLLLWLIHAGWEKGALDHETGNDTFRS